MAAREATMVVPIPMAPVKQYLTIQQWDDLARDMFVTSYGQGLLCDEQRMQEWLEAMLGKYGVTDDPRWEERMRASILGLAPNPPVGEFWLASGPKPAPSPAPDPDLAGTWAGDLFD